MKKIIKNIVLPEDKRIIAISDIHGHDSYLKQLLKRVSFSNDDILFIVGDMIEKGSQNLKTLQYIIQLCKEHTVYPLMGNVDAYALLVFDDDCDEKLFHYMMERKEQFGTCLFLEMCCELGIEILSPENVGLRKNLFENILLKNLSSYTLCQQ